MTVSSSSQNCSCDEIKGNALAMATAGSDFLEDEEPRAILSDIARATRPCCSTTLISSPTSKWVLTHERTMADSCRSNKRHPGGRGRVGRLVTCAGNACIARMSRINVSLNAVALERRW